MEEFNNLLKIICNELNIKLTIFPDGWLKILEKDNKIHYISGYRFDNNNYAIGEIMNDKGLFNDLLNYKGIPTVKQKIIFNNYDKNEIMEYFNNHDNEIIVKGNTSNAGRDVFKVNDLNNLFIVINKLLQKEYSISLSPFYKIKNEYRVIVLNNEVRLVFGKIKPFIIGNGVNTFKELVLENNDYYKDNLDNFNNLDYIPKLNEKIELDFKFNLSKGGKVFTDIPNDLKDKIRSLALNTAKTLNISFASIDVILTDLNELLILEANTGVTLNNFLKQNNDYYDIVYNIYKDAIKLMFD